MWLPQGGEFIQIKCYLLCVGSHVLYALFNETVIECTEKGFLFHPQEFF